MGMFEADLEPSPLTGGPDQAEGTITEYLSVLWGETVTAPSAAPRRRALGVQRGGRIRLRPDASAVAESR